MRAFRPFPSQYLTSDVPYTSRGVGWCIELTCIQCMQLKSVEGYEPGQQLNVEEIFKVGEKVDVAGTTNGKGFQGIQWSLIIL